MKCLDPGAWATSRVLLVAPHQDDEALGCGGTVHLLARAGATVSVVIVARGDGGIVGGAPVEQRERESTRCCELLGAQPPQFLRIPSAALRDDPCAAGRALGDLSGRTAFDLLLVPSPLERHDTHRATLLAALCSGAARPGARWLGYGVWDAIPALDDALEVDVTAARSAKTQAIAAHASQNHGRALAAGMASRDLEQAVFARITGAEERRAVERLMELSDLGRMSPLPESAAAASARVARWLGSRLEAWGSSLWGGDAG